MTGLLSGAAPAGQFGSVSAEHQHLLLPEAARPKSMLEVFLLGGMSPWETFYTAPDIGKPTGGADPSQWWMFQQRGRPTIDEWRQTCGYSNRPAIEPYAADVDGRTINLGPFVYALRDRPDMLARMRVWVMTHELEPHEAAIPLAITGLPRGNPRSASLGTHIQRHSQVLDGGNRTAPYAYTVYQSSFAIDNNGDAASAVGLHRPSARPLSIQLRPGSTLPAQLKRERTAGVRNQHDALVNFYGQRMRTEFGTARANGVDDFLFARQGLAQHQALVDLLPDGILDSELKDICHTQYAPPFVKEALADETTTSLNLARHLLTSPENAARYVQVIEGGVFTDPEGQGYDSHALHVEQQAINLNHMASVLSDIVNRPGESAPGKLNLDDQFILLNTEFGRSPTPEYSIRNPEGYGTDHWPWAYVVVGFGSFVDTARAGIVGGIGANSFPVEAISPADHRAAMLLAMGIWPFSNDAFAIGDFPGATSEAEAARRLREHVLGYPV